jgi:hypothetical protein
MSPTDLWRSVLYKRKYLHNCKPFNFDPIKYSSHIACRNYADISPFTRSHSSLHVFISYHYETESWCVVLQNIP